MSGWHHLRFRSWLIADDLNKLWQLKGLRWTYTNRELSLPTFCFPASPSAAALPTPFWAWSSLCPLSPWVFWHSASSTCRDIEPSWTILPWIGKLFTCDLNWRCGNSRECFWWGLEKMEFLGLKHYKKTVTKFQCKMHLIIYIYWILHFSRVWEFRKLIFFPFDWSMCPVKIWLPWYFIPKFFCFCFGVCVHACFSKTPLTVKGWLDENAE